MLHEGYIDNIYYRYWKVDKQNTAVANVFAIHGFGGHCIWFDSAGVFFNKRNINLFSFDLPGFGQSKFPKGTVSSYYVWLDETRKTLQKFLIQFDVKEPVFILGHSLGALISILLSETVKANGWILSVPGFEGEKNMWPFFSFIVPVLFKGVFKPDENIAMPFGPEVLTKNRDTQLKIKNDPHRVITPCAQMFKHVYFLSQRTKKMHDFPKEPVLVLLAGEDKVCSNAVMDEYFNKLNVEDKCKKIYTNSFHDLFIEDELNQVVNDISVWITEHLTALAKK